MNVTDYIASGILDSYVMDAVSDQERREVNCLSAIYPEIRTEIDQLSITLENYAVAYSVEPPAALRERLFEQISQIPVALPQPELAPAPTPTIVRPMPVERTSGPTFQVTWIAAASVGLVLMLFSLYLFSQLRSNQGQLATLRSSNGNLQNELRQLRDVQAADQARLAVLQRAGMRVIQLRGNEKAPNGDILVYWNTLTRQVSVDVKALPSLPPGQQYQLWSLVGDKPVDAGVFDAGSAERTFQRMSRTIAQADAFAVTVEKRGGSPTPTLSTLLALAPAKA